VPASSLELLELLELLEDLLEFFPFFFLAKEASGAIAKRRYATIAIEVFIFLRVIR